jgi:hypothetical protein
MRTTCFAHLALLTIIALTTDARAEDTAENWGAQYQGSPRTRLGDFLESAFNDAVRYCPVSNNLKKLEEQLSGRKLSRIPLEVYNAEQAHDIVMQLPVADVETNKLLHGLQRVFTTSNKNDILKEIKRGGGLSFLDEKSASAIPQYEPTNGTTYNSDCSLLARSMNKASAAFGVTADAVLNAEKSATSAASFAVGFLRSPIENLTPATTKWSDRRILFEGLWELYKAKGDVPLYYVPRVRSASLVSRKASSSSTDFRASLSFSGGIGPLSLSSDNKVTLSDAMSYTSNSSWSYVFLQPSTSGRGQLVPQFDTLRQLYSRTTVASILSKQFQVQVLGANDSDSSASSVQLELDRYDPPAILVELLYRDGSHLPQELCDDAKWTLSLSGSDLSKLPDAESGQRATFKTTTQQCILALHLKSYDSKTPRTPTNARLAVRLHGVSGLVQGLSFPDVELTVIVRDVFAVQESSAACNGTGESASCSVDVDLFLRHAAAGDSIGYAGVSLKSLTLEAFDEAGTKMNSVVSDGTSRAIFGGSRGKITFYVKGGGWTRANVSYVLDVPRGKAKDGVPVAGNQFTVTPPPATP